MKRCIAIFITLFSAALVFAQAPAAQQNEIGDANANQVEGMPQEALKEVSVDKFEQEGYWSVYISTDSGFSSGRLFSGGPAAKQPIPDEAELQITDTKVFGARIDFLRRGYTSLFVNAVRPIPVEGITKTVTVWVAGRNYNHRMYLILQDAHGKYFELYMGKLNFQGWKKMTAAVPPQDGNDNGIVQNDYHYSTYMGIKIMGFRIDVDPLEAYGSYYFYMDDLRATTDLFAENNRDPDDPRDDW